MSPGREEGAARELLNSSESLRSDLLTAVAKLDSYIEQLKAVMPNRSEASSDESSPPTP